MSLCPRADDDTFGTSTTAGGLAWNWYIVLY